MVDANAMRAPDLVMPRLGDVVCTVSPSMARCVFRGNAAVQNRLAKAFGCDAPKTLRAVRKGGLALLWQGPDEILIVSSDHDADALMRIIADALAAEPHSCVDVSHRQIGFTLAGEKAARLLSTAVMLDLDERAFPVGMVTRTLFGKADIVVWRTAPDQFHIEVWRSFAPYVLGLLAEGARGL